MEQHRDANGKSMLRLRAAAQAILFAITALSVGWMYFFTGSGNMRVNNTVIFRYFTVDSNILCALSSAFLLIRMLRGHRTGGKAAALFRYAGTAAVTVTMMTVLLFLGPVYGYGSMFSNWNLWLHLLGPLLAIVSFVWLERDETVIEKKHLILALLPVIVYGIVYYVMTVLLGEEKGGWPDFYGFNRNGKWYVSYLAMTAGTTLIGIALRKLRTLGRKKA